MTLEQKLVIVREGLRPLKKSAQGHNYKYTDEEQVLNAVIKGLNEQKIDISWEIMTEGVCAVLIQPITVKTKNGDKTSFWVSGVMEFTFINADNVEERQVNRFPFAGMQDDPAQAVGSAATYANRYFLLKRFLIPTTKDDPDNPRGRAPVGKPATPSPNANALEKAMAQVITLNDDEGKPVKSALKDFSDVMLQKIIDMPKAPAATKQAAQMVLENRGVATEVANG